jgi:outer membrane protein assembly factor BamB
MLPERDGIVYSSTKDGLIIAIEGKTGRLLWEHKVGNSFINTVVPLGKGRVLMTETTGEVALLQVQ